MFSDSDITDSYKDHTTSPSLTNQHFFHSSPGRSNSAHSHSTGDHEGSIAANSTSGSAKEMPSLDLLLAFLEEDDEGEDERAAGGGGLQTERRELRDSRGTEQEGRSHSTPSPSLRAARSFSLRSISRQEKPVSSLPPRRLKGRASSAGEGVSYSVALASATQLMTRAYGFTGIKWAIATTDSQERSKSRHHKSSQPTTASPP